MVLCNTNGGRTSIQTIRRIMKQNQEQDGERGGGKQYPPCKGTNCGCTDGWLHSDKCKAEHEEAANLGGMYNKPKPAPPDDPVEWMTERLFPIYDDDGREHWDLCKSDALALAHRCREAERKRDDYEAGYRTYGAKCKELQDQLAAAQAELNELKQKREDLSEEAATLIGDNAVEWLRETCWVDGTSIKEEKAETENMYLKYSRAMQLAQLCDKRGIELAAAQARVAELEAELAKITHSKQIEAAFKHQSYHQ